MRFLLPILLLFVPAIVRAGHAAGLDLTYTHISGNKYRINLTIYGNCNDQPNNNYTSFATGTPQIAIIDSTTRSTWRTISLKLMPDSTRDVSPYCTRYLDSTNCKSPSYAYQGYTRFMYSDTVTLPARSERWIFRFTSAMNNGCSGRLGRPSLDNVVGGNGSNAILEAMLNNKTVDSNSSPRFAAGLFTAYCVNVPSSYYQLAKENDYDSLAFELVRPLREVNTCTGAQPLAYATGYAPLSAVPGSFSFNPKDGTMYFTSAVLQVSAVATKVYEYRKGVLVGYVMREKIFKVLGTCFNRPPGGSIDTSGISLEGGIWYKDHIVACPGSRLRFRIPVKDADGDTITASVTGIPPGSSISVGRNNTKDPYIDFSWNTYGVPTGTYTFQGAYQDNGCPLKSEGLVTYTIVIDDGGGLGPHVTAPTNCIGKASVEIAVRAPDYPYTLNLLQGSSLLKAYTGNAAEVLYDSLAPGWYQLKLLAPGAACPNEAVFEVKDEGVYPFPPKAAGTYSYCRLGDAKPLDFTPAPGALQDTRYRWYDSLGNRIADAPLVPQTGTSGTSKYILRAAYGSCESEGDTTTVIIDSVACNYDINIHNAITPNGDGKNDRWIIDNLGYYPNMTVQVFDKQGDKVFERTNYQNDWDGGTLPSGTYYYLIRLNGTNKTSGTESFTGYLLIKR